MSGKLVICHLRITSTGADYRGGEALCILFLFGLSLWWRRRGSFLGGRFRWRQRWGFFFGWGCFAVSPEVKADGWLTKDERLLVNEELR